MSVWWRFWVELKRTFLKLNECFDFLTNELSNVLSISPYQTSLAHTPAKVMKCVHSVVLVKISLLNHCSNKNMRENIRNQYRKIAIYRSPQFSAVLFLPPVVQALLKLVSASLFLAPGLCFCRVFSVFFLLSRLFAVFTKTCWVDFYNLESTICLPKNKRLPLFTAVLLLAPVVRHGLK